MRFALTFLMCLTLSPASAQFSGGGVSADQMTTALAALAAQMSAPSVSSSIPLAGPGAGLCRFTTVPSNLLSYAGVPGVTGTCSTIQQCGTSATYVVTQMNVGSGC